MPNNQNEIPNKAGDLFTLRSNPFRFLYLAADDLIKDATEAETKNDRKIEVSNSMGAIVLLLLSTEALINRVYDELIRDKFPELINEEISNKWSMTMKWYFAPLLFEFRDNIKTFEVDKEPWQSFSEVKKIRDFFAHLKPIPHRLTISNAEKKLMDYTEGDIPRWPQTKIPKDLNHLRVSDAQKVLETIRQMIDKLDSFMGGIIKKDSWYLTEEAHKDESTDK